VSTPSGRSRGEELALVSHARCMMQGTIKRVVRDRGFGFIKTAEGQEVFFHRSGLRGLNFDSLHEGQTVEFEMRQGDKGPRAENVRGAAE
jgi:cold shock protein